MATPHLCTLRGNNFTGVIITYHNVQQKLKAQAGFVGKSVVFCPSLYIYHNKLRRDDLMEEFTEKWAFPPSENSSSSLCAENIIQYRIEYDTTKEVGYELDFGDLCTEFPSGHTCEKYLRKKCGES